MSSWRWNGFRVGDGGVGGGGVGGGVVGGVLVVVVTVLFVGGVPPKLHGNRFRLRQRRRVM